MGGVAGAGWGGEAPVSCLGEEAGGVVLGWAGRLLLLAALMLVGRLEIVAVLLMFVPAVAKLR